MKRIFIAAMFSLVALTGFSQMVDARRKIEVTGSSEMEIVPDIIYVGMSLKEYFNGNKKMADISELEKQLLDAVVKAGIPRENLFINNVSSYNQVLEKKRNPNFAASKQYRLKLGDPSKFNQVIAALDPKAIEYTRVESYEHSKITELRRQLKIQALKAAKEKASYLAEAVGDNVGDALEIQELNNDEGGMPPVWANTVMRYKAEDGSSADSADIEFRKIKLNYQVRTVFELRK